MENYSHPKASVQHRLGGRAVDAAMYVVTLGIGWFIWSLVVWGQGQTPGKQIVKLRVYDKTTGKPVKWAHMALREFALLFTVYIIFGALTAIFNVTSAFADHPVYGLVVITLPLLVVYLVDVLWIFNGNNRNRLVDLICKTDVLNEAE